MDMEFLVRAVSGGGKSCPLFLPCSQRQDCGTAGLQKGVSVTWRRPHHPTLFYAPPPPSREHWVTFNLHQEGEQLCIHCHCLQHFSLVWFHVGVGRVFLCFFCFCFFFCFFHFFGGVCILVYKRVICVSFLSFMLFIDVASFCVCVCVLKRIKPHAHAVEILWSALAQWMLISLCLLVVFF